MFEAIIWDDRDSESPHPESTLIECVSLETAVKAVADYLQNFPMHAPHIYKVDIRKM